MSSQSILIYVNQEAVLIGSEIQFSLARSESARFSCIVYDVPHK